MQQPSLRFVQEAPPRLILAVEYSHALLWPARRLESALLDAAIAKLLTLDLIADSEVAVVWFGHKLRHKQSFKKLDANLDARLAVYNPIINPFDEAPSFYSPAELAALKLPRLAALSRDVHLNVTKACASLATLLNEVAQLVAGKQSYDDAGFDLVVISSGLFVEDEARVEEVVRAHKAVLGAQIVNLHLIVYPTSVINSIGVNPHVQLELPEAEVAQLVAHRYAKLALLERLTGARVHLVRESLDAQGDARLTTLTQFYEIFETITKGNSWDASDSLVTLARKQVDSFAPSFSSAQLAASFYALSNGSATQLAPQPQQSQFEFKFNVDASVQNELIVGFLDKATKHSAHAASAKQSRRFNVRNLELRSPSGALVLTDALTATQALPPSDDYPIGNNASFYPQQQQPVSSQATSLFELSSELLFAYRSQMKFAGFHLRTPQLALLAQADKLVGTWTLRATVDEAAATTSGVAFARVNRDQNTTYVSCWIQQTTSESSVAGDSRPLRTVKVFARVHTGPSQAPPGDVVSRFEVIDDAGNVVQNSELLDDGLGAPDMTRGDGIHSSLVTRAHKSGFYKVRVELSHANPGSQLLPHAQYQALPVDSHLDNACCGSFVPSRVGSQPNTNFLSRHAYCGSFYLEPQVGEAASAVSVKAAVKLVDSLPAIHSLSVVNVEHDLRRVTFRWLEPSIDVSSFGAPNDDPSTDNLKDRRVRIARNSVLPQTGAKRARHFQREPSESSDEPATADSDVDIAQVIDNQQMHAPARHAPYASFNLSVASSPAVSDKQHSRDVNSFVNKYEFKLFSDREFARAAFDAKPEVGIVFNKWNLDGGNSWPNATRFGGEKMLTLRIPISKQGNYFVAMRVRNQNGLASPVSNVVKFFLYGSNSTSSSTNASSAFDELGNALYSTNASGDLFADADANFANSRGGGFFLLRNAQNSMTGLVLLVVVCVIAVAFSVSCISLVACLVGAKHSTKDTSKSAKQHSSNSVGVGDSATCKAKAHDEDDDTRKFCGGSSNCSNSTQLGANSLSSAASSELHSNADNCSQVGDNSTQLTHCQQLSIGVGLPLPPPPHLFGSNQGADAATHSYHAYQQQLLAAELVQRQQQSFASPSQSSHYDQLQASSSAPRTVVAPSYVASLQAANHAKNYEHIYASSSQSQLDEAAWLAASSQQQTQAKYSPQLSANCQPMGDANENGLGVALGPLASWTSSVLMAHNIIVPNEKSAARNGSTSSSSSTTGGGNSSRPANRNSSPVLDGVLSDLQSNYALQHANKYPQYYATARVDNAYEYYANQATLANWQQQQQQQQQLPPPLVPAHRVQVSANGDEYACVDKSAVSQV